MTDCQHAWRWNDALKQTDCIKCGTIHVVATTTAAGTAGKIVATQSPDCEITVGTIGSADLDKMN